MSKSNAFENAFLLLLFNNTNIANIGDATGLRGSSVAGVLYIGQHTADPNEGGSQNTSEATWTSYARVSVVRTSSGWTITGNQAVNAGVITFPTCTGGSNVIGWLSIGTDASGAGTLLFSSPLLTTWFDGVGFVTDVITIPGNTLSVNDTVVVEAINEQALPTGLSRGTIYYIKTSSGNDVTLSATQGGATLDITGAGALLLGKINTVTVSTGNPVSSFAIGALTVTED